MAKNKQNLAALALKKLEVTTTDQEATIYLYGYIGDEYEWNRDTYEYEQVGVTDIAFVQELNRLAEQYKVIHLRINSLGGSVMHGNAILTAITNCTAEVHTWNDGVAASMAADIWMCGQHRHMARNAMMMVHPVAMPVFGNAEQLRAAADLCEKMTEATMLACAAALGISVDELRTRYYSTGTDVWLNYADAERDGLLTEATETAYQSGDPLPAEASKMAYPLLLRKYAVPDGLEATESMLEKIWKLFTKAPEAPAPAPAPITAANNTDVTLEQFTDALKEGTLDVAAVQQVLAAHQAANAPQPPAPNTDVEELKKTVADLTVKVATLSAQPGASKTNPPAPSSDPGDQSGPPAAVKEFSDELNQGLEQGFNPFRRGQQQG